MIPTVDQIANKEKMPEMPKFDLKFTEIPPMETMPDLESLPLMDEFLGMLTKPKGTPFRKQSSAIKPSFRKIIVEPERTGMPSIDDLLGYSFMSDFMSDFNSAARW